MVSNAGQGVIKVHHTDPLDLLAAAHANY